MIRQKLKKQKQQQQHLKESLKVGVVLGVGPQVQKVVLFMVLLINLQSGVSTVLYRSSKSLIHSTRTRATIASINAKRNTASLSFIKTFSTNKHSNFNVQNVCSCSYPRQIRRCSYSYHRTTVMKTTTTCTQIQSNTNPFMFGSDIDDVDRPNNNNVLNNFHNNSRFKVGNKSDPSDFIDFHRIISTKDYTIIKSDGGDDDNKVDYDQVQKMNEEEGLDFGSAVPVHTSESLITIAKKSKPNNSNNNMNTKIRKTQLKEELREYRQTQANNINGIKKPLYTVFTNAALDGIYVCLPRSKEELLEVKGIGPKKVDMFGDDILEIVSKYTDGDVNDGDEGENVNGGENIRVRVPEKIDAKSLTREQRDAAKIVLGKERRNVFVTGSAGTGKSYLLKYLVQELKTQKKNPNNNNDNGELRNVGIAAPTGVAAIIVGGSTLHSFFGIGLGTGSLMSLLKRVKKNNAAMDRIDEIDVLIIDEVSMMSSELLETLDAITREIRRNGYFRDHPFGGIQIIAFGDFFQLPPVTKSSRDNLSLENRHLRSFCFESEVWSNLGLNKNVIELNEVQRQENEEFVKLLNKVRIGEVEFADVQYINSKCLISKHHPLPSDGIIPTRLYVLNRDVDEENLNRLEELEGPEVVCKAVNRWRESMPTGTHASIKKQMQDSLNMELPDEVRLKIGAQVMLTRNKKMEDSLVNGSRGVVERFVDEGGDFRIPIVRFDNGIVAKVSPVESVRYNPSGEEGCLVRMQIPLKLAWAITIHKSQGSTLSRAILDISSTFEYGQFYVALSRVKSLEGLWLEKPVTLNNIMVSPQVTNFFNKK